MAQFLYSARDADGQKLTGTLEAPDRSTALRLLSEKYHLVTRLEAVRSGQADFLTRMGLGKRITGEDLMAFTHELAAMLNSGIPVKSAMDIMMQDIEHPGLRRVILDVATELGAGRSLAAALRSHQEVFNYFFTSMVEAGETSGQLPAVLTRLARYIERSETLRKQVIGALYYPAIVCSFAALMVTFILIFGVPRVQELYQGLGGKLPWVTQTFINVALGVSKTWYLWATLLVAGFFGLKAFLRSEAGIRLLDRLKLSVYPFNTLMRPLVIARFCRTLGTLYRSNVPILQALELAGASVGNKVMEDVVHEATRCVRDGEPLARPLARSRLFTQMAIGMIAAGEESGALDRMLESIAEFYEVQVEIRLKALTSILEPVMMIGIGLAVGGVIIIMALPFLQLSKQLM
ncbi:MAG TPA: type II secretion system F family protein [Candidatus Nitrosotenuis sp.]|jgi:type II secretory pathway component PulF|nr:type II secretion system F family protein [Candidatus Nitrosotenuis sp.]